MKGPPPPLRFLVGVCAGWTCARAAVLALAGWSGGDPAAVVAPPRKIASAAPSGAGAVPAAFERVGSEVPVPVPASETVTVPPQPRSSRAKSRGAPTASPHLSAGPRPREGSLALAIVARPSASLETNGLGRSAPAAVAPALPLSPLVLVPAPEQRSRPWSLSGWAFVRRAGSAALAPGGTLGGSQAGLRGTWRIAGSAAPLAASLRFTMPLERSEGAEAAAGVDWKPSSRLPVHLLVERRQKLGRDGRSAFGATLYGGVGEVKLGPLRLDGYGQAGVVGLRARDFFADAAVRAALPLGPGGRLRIGGGAWGAAQPNVSRVDVGPHAELRLPLAGANGSLSADWRFRVAGNARPGSGPALTLAAGF